MDTGEKDPRLEYKGNNHAGLWGRVPKSPLIQKWAHEALCFMKVIRILKHTL